MIKIQKIFFSDHADQGQFGKLNLINILTTNTLTFNTFPYLFQTHLSIIGSAEKGTYLLNILIEIQNENHIFYDRINFGLTLQDLTDTTSLLEKIPQISLPMTLKSTGYIIITIKNGEDIIYTEEYKIINGDSPNSGITKSMPISGTFGAHTNVDSNYLIDLLETATKSLYIVDNYIDFDNWKFLLSKVDKQIKITILTERGKKDIKSIQQKLSSLFPNIEIFEQEKMIHDRYIKINSSEYYHFGHSLKNIKDGKLTSFSKLTNQEDIDKLEANFNEILQNSKKV